VMARPLDTFDSFDFTVEQRRNNHTFPLD
ncbi:MAG: hypothetical protein QOE86_3851, partial [Solirubrobacteraceae bacterium]|nr:hypothetical protein [Solirubrobacteraceae bacterium]